MANIEQSHFRFGKDDGTEAAHTFWQLEDVNHSQEIAADWAFLLRFCEQVTTAVANVDAQFQYNKNGAGWVDITTTSSIVKAVAVNAFTNAQSCTKRLSGTGTFESSGQGCTEDGLSGGAQNDIVLNGNSETEAGLQVVFANVANGDTIQFRLTSPDGTMVYTITPTLTITVPAPTIVTPGLLSLILTPYIPTVAASQNVLVTPGTLALAITNYTPLVIMGTVVVPGLLALTITPYIPSVITGTVVVPGVLALTITSYIPEVVVASGGTTVIPGTLSLVIALFTPTVALSDNKFVVPNTLTLILTPYIPTVAVSDHITIIPGTLALTISPFAPSVVLGTVLTPGTLALVLTQYIPTVTVAGNTIIIPGLLELLLTGYVPSVSVGTLITPDTLALLITGYAPVLKLKINPPTGMGKTHRLYGSYPSSTDFEIL